MAIETPFMEGHSFRADELGEAAVDGLRWRLFCYALAILLALEAVVIVYLALRPAFTPIYVEVDRRDGDMHVVGRGDQAYDLREATVKKEVREFIEALRRVVSDKSFMHESWRRLFHHVTPLGHKMLYDYAQKQNPLGDKDLVQITITQVLQQSQNTIYLQWEEIARTIKGELVDTTRWSGLVSWTHRPGTTLDAITHNPSGIYIDEFSITKMP